MKDKLEKLFHERNDIPKKSPKALEDEWKEIKRKTSEGKPLPDRMGLRFGAAVMILLLFISTYKMNSPQRESSDDLTSVEMTEMAEYLLEDSRPYERTLNFYDQVL